MKYQPAFRISILLPLLVMILSANFSAAQVILPKVGLSLANLDIEDQEYYTRKPNIDFAAGIAYEHVLKGSWFFQPEISYVQKGFVYEFHYETETDYYFTKYRLNLYYLELPLLLKYKWKRPFMNMYLAAGPSVAFGLGGKYEYRDKSSSIYDNGNALVNEESFDVKFKDEKSDYWDEILYVSNPFDIGLQFAGGVEILNKMVIDVRYGIGLTRLFDEDNSPANAELPNCEDAKNRVWQITIGFPFKVIKAK